MPSGALAELLARDGELDRILGGRGPSFEPSSPSPGITFGPPLQVEPVDWDRERAEREERERAARIAEATALLEAVEEPPRPDAPAPKQPRRWRTDARSSQPE